MVNTILKEADLFCPNSVRINFTIYQTFIKKPITTVIDQPITTMDSFKRLLKSLTYREKFILCYDLKRKKLLLQQLLRL
ncbi:hypothetical protein EFM12_06900 [Latilactobacillus curvatus]|nr:hypothetical protein CGZ47_00795 [Latilactobacillus curvatus]MCT2880638.1 hypothetical protein [Latilactobacillus curvatus]